MVRERDDIHSRSQDVLGVLTLDVPLALTDVFQVILWDNIFVATKTDFLLAGELTVLGFLNGKQALQTVVVGTDSSNPIPATFSYTWDYKAPKDGDPPSGEAWHQTGGMQIRFHEEDDGGTDRTSDLDLVVAGWTIQMTVGGQLWMVIGASKLGDVYSFNVVPAILAGEDTSGFVFTEPEVKPVLEVELQHWDGVSWTTLRTAKSSGGSAIQGVIAGFPTLLITDEKFRVRAKDSTGSLTTTALGVSWSVLVVL